MAVGDIYRFSAIGDWGAGNLAVVTWHFYTITSNPDPNDVAAGLEAEISGYVKTWQSNTFYWRQINWYLVNRDPAVSGTYTTSFPLQGSVANDSVGQQLAAILTLRTPYAGRSYRGRQYFPGCNEAQATGTGPSSTVTTNLETMAADLITNYGSGGTSPDWRWGVYSKKNNSCTAVTGYVARNVWGVQRRRRAGVGA